MFTFEHFIDLPLIWGGLIATAVLLYVLLDGFDLGIGILFPLAPSDQCRDKMMNSIAPFWDGNETWLVLGGGGLFAAFPLAYSVIMPALYIPVIIMLLCLIFRGVAFEFRFKADTSRKLWDLAFHFGSLGAAFMQGVILGGFVQGIDVEGRAFAGDPFAWLSAFSLMVGLAVVSGYVLLGATWLILKTEGQTQLWARRSASYILIFVAVFMGLVSLWVPFLDNDIGARWFTTPNVFYLMPVPLLTAFCFFKIWTTVHSDCDLKPFIYSYMIFVLGYLGLGISIWPWIVPYEIDIWGAAAAGTSLSVLLIGVAIMLPVILAYTAYCYYLFRGKVDDTPTY